MISIYSKNNTDFDHNGDAVLIPTSCKLSATINGAWQLTLEHPYDPEERYKYIIEGATIVADIRFIRELSTVRQRFRIYNYVKGLHSVTAIAFPIAMESTYDAPIDNLVISGKTGAQAMAQLQTKTNKYTLSSDITRTGSTSFSNTNINSAIASGDDGCFIDVWGGDILYDNLTFAVKNRLGDNVAASHPVIYGRNLTDIEYKKDDSGLTTRIYPISQDGIRLNGTGYVDSSRISDYPVPHSKFMTVPYALVDTNAGSSTSTATKTQQAVSAVSTEASTTSQSVYATLKGNGYQPEYIKTIRNAIVEAVQTMALASVVSTSYYNLMANTIKSAMDWMSSLSQPKWGWMGSDQTGWKYGNATSYAKNMYVKIGKTWSYFGSDGNWQEPKDDSDEWDWHDAKGGTGKKYGNFTKYYAHNEYVYITQSGTIKEYWFNEQGWFEEDESGDSDYYWHGSGTGADPYWFGASSTDYLKSCWRFIDGTYYFFDSYGYVATQKDNYQWDWNENGDSSRAWFGNAVNSEYGSDGACLKSQWQKINGTWYYFDSNGLVVDEAVSQTQTVAAFTTGMASVKTTVDSWASQLYTLLYSLMTAYANKQFASGVDLPAITITVKMADLKKTTEYADYAHLEEIKLGDSVKCIDAVHDITTENRIIGITYDILRDYNESIVIGSASATVAQMVGNAKGEAAAQGFDTTAIENQLTALRNGKQDKLTPGDNVTIENNVISVDLSGTGTGDSTIYYGVGAPLATLGSDHDAYAEISPDPTGNKTLTYATSRNWIKRELSEVDGVYTLLTESYPDRYERAFLGYSIGGLQVGKEYIISFTAKLKRSVSIYSDSQLFGITVQNSGGWEAIDNHVTDGAFEYYNQDGGIYWQSLKTDTKRQTYTFRFTAMSSEGYNKGNFFYVYTDGVVNDTDVELDIENLYISDGTLGNTLEALYVKVDDEWMMHDTTYQIFDTENSGLVPRPVNLVGDDYTLRNDSTWKTEYTENHLNNGLIGSAGGSYITCPLDANMTNGQYKFVMRDGDTTIVRYFNWEGSTVTLDIDNNYTMQITETTAQLTWWRGSWRNIYGDILGKYAVKSSGGGGTQVQSDWTQTDTSAVDYIKNKPTLATVATTGDYDDLTDKPSLATVATSGDYDDLTNKPTIPAAQVQSDWSQTDNTQKDYIKNKPTLATVATSGAYSDLSGTPTLATVATTGDYDDLTDKPNLATVATSGDYDDLTNKPTIPAAQVNSDWNSSSGVSQILNKPTLATVATSGSYNDLTSKPTIPSVEANPSGTGSVDLSKLEVDGTIYNVPSGGGSDLPLTVENGKLCIIYET